MNTDTQQKIEGKEHFHGSDLEKIEKYFGIPKEQAILSATLIPARELGCENEIGSIAAGKLADFVICDENLNRTAVYLDGKTL